MNEETVNLLIAAGLGVIGGLVNVAYFHLQQNARDLIHHREGDIAEIASALNNWQRVLTPTLGGVAAGLVLFVGLRYAGRRRTGNLLEVVVAGDGRLPMREALIKGVSSLLSISSGASIGREGLVTQLSATFGSKWGQLFKWPPYRLRLLIACGAAAGLSAAYNAPIAGALFAAQIVLGNFSMHLFAPLLCSSVVATVVCRSYLGNIRWYEVPAHDFTRLSELPWFLVVGLGAGLLGALFLRLMRDASAAYEKLNVSLPVRMGLGGLIVGVLAVFYPAVWGNGYNATTQLLNDSYSLNFLLGLTLAKLLATVATVGSGAVGGVMTPTLFLGAALGGGLGAALGDMGYVDGLPAGAFALVGMGAMLAATTHSALLAILMVFELSLNYSLMPPLMLACAVATLISRKLHPESVYTAALEEKSLLAERESAALGAASRRTVADLMQEPVEPILENLCFADIADRFLTSTNNYLPVVDFNGRLQGVVVLQDLKQYLGMGPELNAVIAMDVMRPAPVVLHPAQTLVSILPNLLATDIRNVPVVNNFRERRLIGRVVRSEALGMLSEALSAQSGGSPT